MFKSRMAAMVFNRQRFRQVRLLRADSPWDPWDQKTKPPLKFSNFTGENHGENDDRLTSGFRGTLKSESLAPGRGRQSTYPVIKCGWRIPWGPRDSNG